MKDEDLVGAAQHALTGDRLSVFNKQAMVQQARRCLHACSACNGQDSRVLACVCSSIAKAQQRVAQYFKLFHIASACAWSSVAM